MSLSNSIYMELVQESDELGWGTIQKQVTKEW